MSCVKANLALSTEKYNSQKKKLRNIAQFDSAIFNILQPNEFNVTTLNVLKYNICRRCL